MVPEYYSLLGCDDALSCHAFSIFGVEECKEGNKIAWLSLI
jgi:hypothetical protein